MSESATNSQANEGSAKKKKRRLDPMWSNFSEEVHKEGAEVLVCKQCQRSFSSRVTVTTLKLHWERNHKTLETVVNTSGSQKQRKSSTAEKKLEDINRAFTDYLEAISKVCGPFVEVLRRIQGEKFVTISHCWEYTKALLLSLDAAKESMNECYAPLIERFRRSMMERFTNILNMSRTDFDPTFLVASALDPNTSGCLNDDDLNKAAEWIRQLLPTDQRIRRTESMAPTTKTDSTLDCFISQLKKDAETSRKRTMGQTSRSKSWILNALHSVQDAGSSGLEPVDAIKYWSGLLSLELHVFAGLALEVLTVPATSAPIERIFSQAGIATRRHMNRTELETFNHQLVVYCNRNV